MRVLVESLEDPASSTIAAELRKAVEWDPDGRVLQGHVVESSDALPGTVLVPIQGLHVHAEALDERLAAVGVQAEEVIFLSRHASQSRRPTLTVHPLGNFGPAKYGGTSVRFTPVPARRMSQLLRALAAAREAAAYAAEVSFEVTHHGPLLSCPAFFVELGSSSKEWTDPAGGAVVARAVIAALSGPMPDHSILLGIGGGHYAPRFTDAALRRGVDYGHMWPSHALGEAEDLQAAASALVAATPGVVGAHLHEVPRKVRSGVREALAQAGVPVVSAKEADAASTTG